MIIHIYGESDDLVEIEGGIEDEFNAYNGGTLTLSAPNGEAVDIACTFAREGVWMFSPIPKEGGGVPEWPMGVRLGARQPGRVASYNKIGGVYAEGVEYRAPTYSTILSIAAPKGTAATLREKT